MIKRCLESDEELPFKKRKLCYRWDKEMARDERVYGMMKVKMETTIMHELADAPDEGEMVLEKTSSGRKGKWKEREGTQSVS